MECSCQISATVAEPSEILKEGMGEFSVPLPEYCVYCSGQGCGACKGKGEVIRRIHVPWTTIKEVYAKASIQEYIEDGNEIPEKCIARLTPGAREWVCGIIEDVWRREEV